MSDQKVQDLTALATPVSTDVLYIVDDPAGTPLDRKVTVANLAKGMQFIDQSDTPAAYTDSALQLTRVNAGETALEFVGPGDKGSLLVGNDSSGWADFGVGATGSILVAEAGENLGMSWSTPLLQGIVSYDAGAPFVGGKLTVSSSSPTNEISESAITVSGANILGASSGLTTKISTANTSNPPTDAELDTAFGTPATVGAGFFAILDDAGAGTAVYHVSSDGTNWWYTTATKAV